MTSISAECSFGATRDVALPPEALKTTAHIEPCLGCLHLGHAIISALTSHEDRHKFHDPNNQDHIVSVTLDANEKLVVDTCECQCRPPKKRY